jgi:nuclear cap-binding protein subunit 2
MGDLLFDLQPKVDYVDRKAMLAAPSEEAYLAQRNDQVARSTTVYVGNLSYYTTEQQIWAHMGSTGAVRRIVMGLNAVTAQPCGFCFVEYCDQHSAVAAVASLHLSRLDDRVVRVSWDIGGDVAASGRRWGRGFTGGQTRDEYRQGLDNARGGLSVRRSAEAGVERSLIADEVVTYGWVVRPPPRGHVQAPKALGGAFAAKDAKRARGE